MLPFNYPIPQTIPPLALGETLPTMYDLPSEDPEEPGLPDEFHVRQPQLLSITFRPPNADPSQVFTISDMNLYYDSNHLNWYKRPDWFGVVGVSRLYDDFDLRLSYVIWQERISPYVVVELLSPGTEKEDLGEMVRELLPESEGNGQSETTNTIQKPPGKWEVYEQILQVPYYVVFSRYTNELRVFKLQESRYQELELSEPRVWMPELDIGLGIWQGEYQGCSRLWLRWYDEQRNWIPTEAEQAEQERLRADLEYQRAEEERLRAEQERLRAEQEQAEKVQAINEREQERQRAEEAELKLQSLRQRLRESGINPDTFLDS